MSARSGILLRGDQIIGAVRPTIPALTKNVFGSVGSFEKFDGIGVKWGADYLFSTVGSIGRPESGMCEPSIISS